MNFEHYMIALRRITEEISREAIRVLGETAPSPLDTDYPEFVARLSGWQKRLELLDRSAKSREHMAHVRTGSRRPSYGERQSRSAHIDNARRIRREIRVALSDLNRLGDALYGTGPFLNVLSEALDQGTSMIASFEGTGDLLKLTPRETQAVSSITQQLPTGISGPSTSGGSTASAVLMLWVAVALLIKLAGERRQAGTNT